MGDKKVGLKMNEQPEEVGKAKLSKSGKAVMFYFDKPTEVAMVSVRSMKSLLNGEWNYVKLRRPSSK
jgi:hypothetical protein